MTVALAILAVLAFLIALPPFANMFFGGPSINLRFERTVENGVHFLPVYVENRPVTNWLLRLLRVRRSTVQGLSASFRITEAGTGKILIPIRQAYLVTDAEGEMKNRITLNCHHGRWRALGYLQAIRSWRKSRGPELGQRDHG